MVPATKSEFSPTLLMGLRPGIHCLVSRVGWVVDALDRLLTSLKESFGVRFFRVSGALVKRLPLSNSGESLQTHCGEL